MASTEEGRVYSGVERAAVLMMLVGEEEAAAILQKLEPDEVRELGKAMYSIADVSEQDVGFVLDDFVGCARARTAIAFQPKPIVENLMNRALGPERAGSVLSRIVPAEAQCEIEMLGWLDPVDIAKIVEKEHPQIGAVLIANCDPAVAGKVLELLPEAMQPDILHRVARLGPVTPQLAPRFTRRSCAIAGSASNSMRPIRPRWPGASQNTARATPGLSPRSTARWRDMPTAPRTGLAPLMPVRAMWRSMSSRRMRAKAWAGRSTTNC